MQSNQRLVALDVIRGFALLGILLMNIQGFAMPSAAYLNPTAYGDFNGVNYWVWLLSHLFADQKFMSLFSMLFGVGVLIFAERVEARGMSATGLHYRRILWLMIFGLLHGYLFWFGDILFSYAVCGLWVFLLRGKSPKTLLTLALTLIAVSSLINLATGLVIPKMPAQDINEIMESWKPDNNQLATEINAYTGSWLSALKYRANETFFMQTYVLLTVFMWRAGGMMLLGMALYKTGFFNLQRSNRFYLGLALIGSTVGLALILTGVQQNQQHGFSLHYSMFIGSQFNYWGSLCLAMSYASLIMLMVKYQWLSGLQQRLAAIGKTAFSNYILHTLVCTSLFYGLGLFASVSRIEQLVIVLLIWVVQLWLSPVWLKHFYYGPLEWLWRSLTYRKKQKMIRKN